MLLCYSAWWDAMETSDVGFFLLLGVTVVDTLPLQTDISHRIHVWYIYLHLVDLYGKCR